MRIGAHEREPEESIGVMRSIAYAWFTCCGCCRERAFRSFRSSVATSAVAGTAAIASADSVGVSQENNTNLVVVYSRRLTAEAFREAGLEPPLKPLEEILPRGSSSSCTGSGICTFRTV